MGFPPIPMPAELLTDRPRWIYPTRLATGKGAAHLRVWRTDNDRILLVTVGELDDTGGPSVTNGAVDLWRELHRVFPGRELVVLEHWSPGSGVDIAEHLDQVVVEDGRSIRRRVWPTSPTNPGHFVFQWWIRAHGHDIIGFTPADVTDAPPATEGNTPR